MAPSEEGTAPRGAGEERKERRHLERLRRDLEDEAEACRKNPEACTRGAEASGSALGELDRMGRAAGPRRRLAEAVRQFLERIRRGDAGGRAGEATRRFAQSANGPSGARALSVGGVNEGAASDSAGMHAEPSEAAVSTGAPRAQSLTSDTDQSGGTGVAATSSTGGAATGAGAGAGIGSQPGGPVLGARATGTSAGAAAARDIAAAIADSGPGPSRAQIIGSAAGRGFATLQYQQVFDDYRAAVEESMNATAVPAGRRYLVRRYFQLIRPRTMP